MNPEYLSGEASASPAVEPLLAAARSLAESGVGGGLLAARNGPRVTTHAQVPFEALVAQDFVEVADYDPHLDRLMLLGSRPPHPHAGLAHLVFRAKKEVGALMLLDAPPAGRLLASASRPRDLAERLPQAKRGRTTLENALGVLEALRGADAVAWNGQAVVVGQTPAEALARAQGLL